MNPASFSFRFIQSELRIWLPFFSIASVVLVAGVASLLLAVLRSRDRLLVWLGVFSILYAVRLFVENNLVHTAIGANDRYIFISTLCLTYLIPIPYASFARELFGSGWKRSILIWLWLEIAFALIAIPTVLFSLSLHGWTDRVNGALVIGGTVLVLFHSLRPNSSSPFAKDLTWPGLICGAIVLLNNLGYRLAGRDIEPFGILILLAGLGAVALRRAVMRERKLVEMEQELTTARRIQSSIIPDSRPKVKGMDIATRYEPMTAVAGDFFDFVQIDDQSLTILVADVSGHGVPAALVASMLKVCFAAQRENAHDPAKILAGLNTMLRGSLGGQYVTVACAAIDLAQNKITYAGAGHPPSLLFRKSKGEVVALDENGLFIGPFPQATYSNMTASFENGDKLMLYTDGITEATAADGQEFGQQRVERLLLETGDSGPGEFIAQLFRKISTPAQQDDLTVVVTQFEAAV